MVTFPNSMKEDFFPAFAHLVFACVLSCKRWKENEEMEKLSWQMSNPFNNISTRIYIGEIGDISKLCEGWYFSSVFALPLFSDKSPELD